MKCGNCKLWKHDVQEGMTKKDLKKDYKIFGKALGLCTCDATALHTIFGIGLNS